MNNNLIIVFAGREIEVCLRNIHHVNSTDASLLRLVARLNPRKYADPAIWKLFLLF